jgi:2-methylcitrate dehydratase
VDDVRPVFPADSKTSLEMAGFLNAFLLRCADWGDTYRRKDEVFGHPSDQVATILALCDASHVSGAQIVALTHFAYQLYAVLGERMPGLRQPWDYTSALALTVPAIAGLCFHASEDRLQNALYLSAAGGAVLHQVRTEEITSLKSGASAYATARGLWCYRVSGAIKAPSSMFEGKDGWYRVIAPLEGELVGMGSDRSYAPVEVKSFPCFHVAQSPVECAIDVHEQLEKKTDKIRRIEIHVTETDSKRILRSDQRKYPLCQSEADHHIKYCLSIALLHGALTPLHYKPEFFHSKLTRQLIDLIEVQVLDSEKIRSLGNKSDACLLEVLLEDGEIVRSHRSQAEGSFSGLKTSDRVVKLQRVVEKKRKMLEQTCGIDLNPVERLVCDLENHEGYELLDVIQASIQTTDKESI